MNVDIDAIVRCRDGFLTETKKIPIAEVEMKEKGYGWGDTEASQQKRGSEYADLMGRGIHFPPIKVFGKRHKSDTYQVFDGHARLTAHKINKDKFIEAEITLVDDKGNSMRC